MMAAKTAGGAIVISILGHSLLLLGQGAPVEVPVCQRVGMVSVVYEWGVNLYVCISCKCRGSGGERQIKGEKRVENDAAHSSSPPPNA